MTNVELVTGKDKGRNKIISKLVMVGTDSDSQLEIAWKVVQGSEYVRRKRSLLLQHEDQKGTNQRQLFSKLNSIKVFLQQQGIWIVVRT